MGDVLAITHGSKELKKNGFRFVGLMQVVGLVNDHIADCVVRTGAP